MTVEKWKKAKYKRDRENSLYMDIAVRVSEMSYAKKLNVGCVIVKNDNIISFGWNGMPTGWDNNCEFYVPGDDNLTSKPEVLHAEANALTKLAVSHNSSVGATLYITHSPCIECAKLIFQSKISAVYYKEVYRSEDGITFLEKCGIPVFLLS